MFTHESSPVGPLLIEFTHAAGNAIWLDFTHIMAIVDCSKTSGRKDENTCIVMDTKERWILSDPIDAVITRIKETLTHHAI